MTFISIRPERERSRLELRAGVLVPRVIGQGASSARVALVAGGALLLGGDDVRIDVLVGAGCLLELEDIGGTVAYGADGVRSTWTVNIRVESSAVLLWHGLPFVVADTADVVRTTRVSLADSATVCIRETVVLGRAGEAGGRIRQRTDVAGQDLPIFVEELTVGAGADIPGVIGTHRVLDSVLIAGARGLSEWDEVRPLQFEQPGSLARHLGSATHASPLGAVWGAWSGRLREAGRPVRETEVVR